MLWSSWAWPPAPHWSCPPCSRSSRAHSGSRGNKHPRAYCGPYLETGDCWYRQICGRSEDFPSLGQLVPCWITGLEKLEKNPKMRFSTAGVPEPTALLRVCMVTVCSSGFGVRTLTGTMVCSWSPCQSLKRLLQVQGLALSKFRPLGLSQHSLHGVLPCPLS